MKLSRSERVVSMPIGVCTPMPYNRVAEGI